MNKKKLFKKGLVFGILILFIGISIIQSSGRIISSHKQIITQNINESTENMLSQFFLFLDKVKSIICANVDPYDSDKYIDTGRINAYKAITEFNTEPNKPDRPSGPSRGKPDTEYTFTASSSDPDGDQLLYLWDWGDDTFSEWLDTTKASHTWTNEDIFNISVRVKDIHGAISEWSDPLHFSTPKVKSVNTILEMLKALKTWMQRITPSS